MSENYIKIICAVHKEWALPSLPYLFPLHVGAQTASFQLPYAKDNEGENISEKNASYNEITALYWVWKNNLFREVEYIGLCHYRRYLMANKPLFSKRGIYRINSLSSFLKSTIDLPETVKNKLSNYDLIISKPSKTSIANKELTIEESYAHYHHAADWNQLKEVIRDKQPAYYNSFLVWGQLKRFNQLNIFVGKRQFLDEYMPWLMSILEPLETRVAKHGEPYQQRAIGFLSERLLSLYIYHHQLKTYWLPVAFLQQEIGERLGTD